jgi:hypothetical protein
MLRSFVWLSVILLQSICSISQEAHISNLHSSTVHTNGSAIRIKNMNPYFTLHVDSVIQYQFEINKPKSGYQWKLVNAPLGVRINKDEGYLLVKVEKSFFVTGKLKYETEYNVGIQVRSITDPNEKSDTSFTILFYNTDIIPSTLKPSVTGTLLVDEGNSIRFTIQCENGSFPVERISFFANSPLSNYTAPIQCNQDFTWTPGFDFVDDKDSAKVRVVELSFVGANKFMMKDTAVMRIVVNDAINYPLMVAEYYKQGKAVRDYILQLKYTFLQLDRSVKRIKTTRATFDVTGSTAALTGSVLGSSKKESTLKTARLLPGIGISLVPFKEAVAPPKTVDQNQAALIRASIKRLEYMLADNMLTGERDALAFIKTNKLKDELKQIQVQLVDMPVDVSIYMSEQELNRYFNSKKVKKKYMVKK